MWNPRQELDPRANKILASSFAMMALVLGIIAGQVPWAPRLDFDVTGFLFVAQNILPLTLWGLTFFFVAVAVACVIRLLIGKFLNDE